MNAMIEADRVTALGIAPELVDTPSESGKGQKIARCPKCRVAVWSHYAGAGPLVSFVRVGTLDNPDVLPPDIHIFTSTRLPWVVIPPGARVADVTTRSIDDVPVLALTLWSDDAPGAAGADLRRVAAELAAELRKEPGVARAGLLGGEPRTLRIGVKVKF